MKNKLLFIVIPLIIVFLIIALQVIFFMVIGKKRVATLPFIGSAFVINTGEKEVVEVHSGSYKEVEDMVENLKKLISDKETVVNEHVLANERLKNEIKRLTDETARLKTELDRTVLLVQKHREEGIRSAAATYESTDPQVVAEIFKNLTDDECAMLLYFMRDRQAAKVIEAYAAMGKDDITRNDNAKRMAEINRRKQKIILESETARP